MKKVMILIMVLFCTSATGNTIVSKKELLENIKTSKNGELALYVKITINTRIWEGEEFFTEQLFLENDGKPIHLEKIKALVFKGLTEDGYKKEYATKVDPGRISIMVTVSNYQKRNCTLELITKKGGEIKTQIFWKNKNPSRSRQDVGMRFAKGEAREMKVVLKGKDGSIESNPILISN